jgi:hypothetical protein
MCRGFSFFPLDISHLENSISHMHELGNMCQSSYRGDAYRTHVIRYETYRLTSPLTSRHRFIIYLFGCFIVFVQNVGPLELAGCLFLC